MRHFFILIIALCPMLCMGQTNYSKERPTWADGYFQDLQNSYIESVSVFDYSVDLARQRAANEVIKRRDMATGTEVNVSYGNEITVKGKDNLLIVKARIIDEYIERAPNGWNVHILVQVAKDPGRLYENVGVTQDYPFSARNLIPGMGQIYKGSKAKGATIITLEALSVGSIIVCENQRASYVKKAKEQPKFAKEYASKADNYETYRNVSIGVAAAVWVYSIIDATVAKGKKRVFVKGLSAVPFAQPDGAAGIQFAYKF